MTIVFAGGEMPSFVPSVTGEGETVGDFDGNYARCDIPAIGGGTGDIAGNTFPWIESELFTPLTTAWTHMEFKCNVGEGGDGHWLDRVIWYDVNSVPRIKIQAIEAGSMLRFMCDTGSGFAQVGANYNVDYTNRQTFDICIQCNSSSGRIRLYNTGTRVYDSGTVDLSAVPNIAAIRFVGAVSGYGTPINTYVSQVIIANEATIGWKLMTYVPSGAGLTSAWTGTYADVDEIVYDDGGFITTAAAGAVENFAGTPVSPPDGSEIKALIVTARARSNGAGPASLALNVNVSGVDYFSSSILQDAGFTPNIGIWELNPHTASPWLDVDLTTLKVGVKAIA
jgi:hypothetical protein